MLSNVSLEKVFSVEATNLKSYLVNWSPHQALDGKVPEMIWSGNPPNYFNLRVFGCLAYVQVSQGNF